MVPPLLHLHLSVQSVDNAAPDVGGSERFVIQVGTWQDEEKKKVSLLYLSDNKVPTLWTILFVFFGFI